MNLLSEFSYCIFPLDKNGWLMIPDQKQNHEWKYIAYWKYRRNKFKT